MNINVEVKPLTLMLTNFVKREREREKNGRLVRQRSKFTCWHLRQVKPPRQQIWWGYYLINWANHWNGSREVERENYNRRANSSNVITESEEEAERN